MADKVEFDGGDILNFLGQIKDLLAKFNVDLSRLKEVLPLFQSVVEADYHDVDGMRAGLNAIVDIADIIALDNETVLKIKGLVAVDGPIELAVWVYNKLTGYETHSFGEQPLVVGGKLVESVALPDLSEILPIILWLMQLLQLIKR